MIMFQARNIPYARVVSHTWIVTKSLKSGKWSTEGRQDAPRSGFCSEFRHAHFMCSRPKSTFQLVVVFSEKNPNGGTLALWGPMGPTGPWVPHGPMEPIGPHGPHGGPWAPWGPWAYLYTLPIDGRVAAAVLSSHPLGLMV